MEIEKVFDTTIEVRDAVNFCADTNRHTLAELRRIYEGRCFKGVFIVRVKEIRRASPCRIESTNTSGNGTIDVEFSAAVMLFSCWDILVGVKIDAHQTMVLGIYETPTRGRAIVSLRASKAAETIAVGQRVPVRAIAVSRPPMQDSAAVVAALLTCDQAAPVYSLRGSLDGSAKLELRPILEAVDRELAARAELLARKKADVWFFETILCSYRRDAVRAAGANQRVPTGGDGDPWEGPPAFAIEPGATTRNVLEIVRQAVAGAAPVPVAGLWSRSLALYRSSPLVAFAEARPPAGWAAAVESTPRVAFAEFLKNILDFLVAIREMVEVYSSPEMVESHRNVWTVMRSAQKVQP